MKIFLIYFYANFIFMLRLVRFLFSEFLFYAQTLWKTAASHFFPQFYEHEHSGNFCVFYYWGDFANLRNREVWNRNSEGWPDVPLAQHTKLQFFPQGIYICIYRFWTILTLNRDCILKGVKCFSLVTDVQCDVR